MKSGSVLLQLLGGTKSSQARLMATLSRRSTYEPVFGVEMKDEGGVLVADIEKVLHVRKKPAAEPSGIRGK
jgi:hypothetical protein